MLGTNDLLENPDFTAADVAKRMERFLKRLMEEAGLASVNETSADCASCDAGRSVGGPAGTSYGIPESRKRISEDRAPGRCCFYRCKWVGNSDHL